MSDPGGPSVFVDANVPIYAAGRPHALKQPCAQIQRFVAEHSSAFVTDAEVLQELVHRYIALGRWSQGRELVRSFAELMRGRVESVTCDDVVRAADLAGDVPRLSARDLLHAAIMKRLGVRRIVSADAGFDHSPDIERLDPAKWPQWRSSLIQEQPAPHEP